MNMAVILVTHSKYMNVCDFFMYLKKKHWTNCEYKTILSYMGPKLDNISSEYIPCYNGNDASLPQCIYNACQKNNLDYCICFLGDAFMYKDVDSEKVNEIIADVIKNNVDYCRLQKLRYNTEKPSSKNAICPFSHTSRGVSFVAFIASRRFVEEQFSNNITDYEFEIKYLRYTYQKEVPDEWKRYKMYMAVNNEFHIAPGITQGMWDRDAYNVIKKYNFEAPFPHYPLTPLRIHLIRKVAYGFILDHISTRYTKKIKCIVKKLGIYKFASEI